ncbi:MAG: COQ9 family protein [Acetobacteraceae bacterium]|nr:COQ9 family protein [Acetobacteraceae bacterium]
MITPPERSAERDAAIDAILAHVPFDGWTLRALHLALAEVGLHPDDAALLFPGGAGDLVEAFCDLADRRMVLDVAAMEAPPARLGAGVSAAIALRLARNRAHKEAVRRAVSVLALPQNARIAVVCGARTVDAIWQAAGDESADFSWYTKRVSLAAIYGATVLFWLRDTSPKEADTLAFLNRRLADLGRIGALRRGAEALLARFTPAALRPVPPAGP